VQGNVGTGYEPVVPQINTCVENALRTVEQINKKIAAENTGTPLKSILIPLIGAGTAKLSPQESADIIMTQLVESLALNPSVTDVYILTFIESHRAAVRAAADKLKLELEREGE